MGMRGGAFYRINGLRPPDSAIFILPSAFPLSGGGVFAAQGVKASGGIVSIVRTDTCMVDSLRVRPGARVSAARARAGSMVWVYSSRNAFASLFLPWGIPLAANHRAGLLLMRKGYSTG